MHWHACYRRQDGTVSRGGVCSSAQHARDVVHLLSVSLKAVGRVARESWIESCSDLLCLANQVADDAEFDADVEAMAGMDEDEADAYLERRRAAITAWEEP